MANEPTQINNAQSEERILKNTSYLTLAFVLQKILSFLYFIYIARSIGPVDLGLYDPIKSLIPILLILIDFSLSVVLVREIARAPERVEEYLGSVLGIKAVFAFVVILGMGLFTNFSGYSVLIKTVLYLDAIIVILDTFTLTFFAVFRGLQNMKYEAIGMIGTQILTIIFGVTGLQLNWGLRALFVAVIIGSIFNFIFSFLMVRRKIKIRIRLSWNKKIIKSFLKIAVPFAIAAMFVKIYTYTDRYLLLLFSGRGAVGWYVTAHKLTYALEFIPSAFAASIFPAMSSFFIYDRSQLARTFTRASRYLLIIAVPISLGVLVLADKIVLTLYGLDFETSIFPLRILMIGLLVIFLNFPVGAFLNACNLQIKNTINMGITVAINVALNLILIPQYSFNGAAIAALVSGIVLFLLGLRWVGSVVQYDKIYLLRALAKTVLAGGVMAGLLWLLKDAITFIILIPVGAICYFAVLYAFKGISKDDIRRLYTSFINRKV